MKAHEQDRYTLDKCSVQAKFLFVLKPPGAVERSKVGIVSAARAEQGSPSPSVDRGEMRADTQLQPTRGRDSSVCTAKDAEELTEGAQSVCDGGGDDVRGKEGNAEEPPEIDRVSVQDLHQEELGNAVHRSRKQERLRNKGRRRTAEKVEIG